MVGKPLASLIAEICEYYLQSSELTEISPFSFSFHKIDDKDLKLEVSIQIF